MGRSGDWRLYFLHRDRVEQVRRLMFKLPLRSIWFATIERLGCLFPQRKPSGLKFPSVQTSKNCWQITKDGREQFKKARPLIRRQPTSKGEPSVNWNRGIPYSFLSKKTRGASVNMMITLRFGDEKSLFGKASAAEFLGRCLKRGTTKYSFQEIKVS